MGKGVFKMYTTIRKEKNRKSLFTVFNSNMMNYPKHQDVEIRANIANYISIDLSNSMRYCARDILTIVSEVVGRGN